MEKLTPRRKSPSRETCESAIKRILMTEVLQNGSNKHFRSAADFMNYFESLYTPSDALTKQVQRAIKSLNMPRDEKGYYIVNKTTVQLEQERQLRKVLEDGNASIHPMDNVETVLLHADPGVRSYLIHLIERSESFQDKYITIAETSNGLLFFTKCKNKLMILLNSLTT